ncbi:unnamed protein product [Clavelina lepadiformis]|uniref:Uncharacterized protein n=1 Tax=Clavelina lepadiformis TaxID=159417 RepID=A0ABP0GPG7_CLALP
MLLDKALAIGVFCRKAFSVERDWKSLETYVGIEAFHLCHHMYSKQPSSLGFLQLQRLTGDAELYIFDPHEIYIIGNIELILKYTAKKCCFSGGLA